MPRWYYEKKELRQTPSTLMGMDSELEARYRREGARFIIDMGTAMKLSLTTMATGVVYFHRFYMQHTFQDFPRYPTSCACLFLAGKVEETPKKCKDVIKWARDLLPDNKFAQFGGDIRNSFEIEMTVVEEVMTLERILLQTIKFDLQVEHPYTFLLQYAKCLKGDKTRLQKMVQMAWTFVNDSLCTTLCLQWEPEIIAIALMYLAGKLSKFEVVDWNGRTGDHLRWWDMFVEDMTIELLEDICHQVLDLYSQTQNPTPSESPPPKASGIGLPPHFHSAQNSPLTGPTTPIAGSSKTSTPVAAMTPTMPGAVPPPSASYHSHNAPPVPFNYPPPMPGIPFGAPPPGPSVPGTFSKGSGPTSAIPPPNYPPGQSYYPPPPLPSTRSYQPPPPPK